uniref:Ig-like domain-containing protein n=1 Tax=Periophthalmus magnuspinnatus TaxID=409849 RepID=A0A3B4ARA4_9GOBI
FILFSIFKDQSTLHQGTTRPFTHTFIHQCTQTPPTCGSVDLTAQPMFLSRVGLWHAKVQSAFSNKESVQREVKVVLSQAAVLSCDVSNSKTEVKWYKDGKLLSSSKAVHTESKGMTRQLVIDKVEKKDTGEYICEVGSEKLAFRIHVEGTCFGEKVQHKHTE